jgi:hypothetical protein
MKEKFRTKRLTAKELGGTTDAESKEIDDLCKRLKQDCGFVVNEEGLDCFIHINGNLTPAQRIDKAALIQGILKSDSARLLLRLVRDKEISIQPFDLGDIIWTAI